MSIYKKTILVLSLLVASLSGYAAGDEAQYKSISKSYTIGEDGSYTLQVVKEITLLTHLSFNRLFGETFVEYNPERESIKVNESYTIQADGTVVKAPANAFNEVLPSFAANAPAFNHIKTLVMTHTGLEIGSTIHLDYTITSKPAANGQTPFDVVEIIEDRAPVKEYTISFEAPASQPLRFSLSGSKVKPQVSGNKTTFKFKGVATASIEKFKPENGSAPTLVATTAAAEFVASKYAEPKICNSTTFNEVIKEVITASDATSKVEQALVYLNSRVANSALPFIYQDNKERCASTIINSGYATAMEKASLLRAMLTVSGTPYEMIFVYPNTVEADMLTLSTLKGVIFKVENKYYSALSPKAIDPSERASLDNFYALSNGSLTAHQVAASAPSKESYTASVSADMASESGYIRFTPEHINDGVRGWGLTSLPSSRTDLLELKSAADQSQTWTIAMESGVELQSPTFEKTITESFGTLSISLSKSGNSVTLTRSIKFTKQTISRKEYAKFREFINAWQSSKGAEILFEVK